MTEQERYLFDLQGFLVVPDALAPEEIAALNGLLDERLEREAAADAGSHRFGRLLEWGKPFRDLIDNPRILPYLRELISTNLRLDHEYADVIRSGKGPIGTILHGGATPFDPTGYYRFDNGRMHNGLTVVAYNLHDVNPGEGGFGCVPGSHKSNLHFPMEWLDLDAPHDCVKAVTGKAGTAVLFTEALTHGTLPWRAKHERRTLFYKYSPPPLSWTRHYYNAADYSDLTSRQRDLLQPPHMR